MEPVNDDAIRGAVGEEAMEGFGEVGGVGEGQRGKGRVEVGIGEVDDGDRRGEWLEGAKGGRGEDGGADRRERGEESGQIEHGDLVTSSDEG